MVNDGILDSQSNAAAYDQVSCAQARRISGTLKHINTINCSFNYGCIARF
jgi:hypothetical protein